MINLCLKLEDLSAEELESLAAAVGRERRRREWPRSSTAEAGPVLGMDLRVTPMGPSRSSEVEPERLRRLREELEAVDRAADERRQASERWAVTRHVVAKRWPQYRTPWYCPRCSAEWCRIRQPPPTVPQTPIAPPPA